MKRILICVVIVVYSLSCLAMFDDYEPSARARAMSGAVTSFNDDFNAIFYNPAGLKYAEKTVGASYYKLYNNDFSVAMAVAGAFDTPVGSFGVGAHQLAVEYYDVTLMSEQKFSLGYSRYLFRDIHSEVALGVSGNLYSLTYDELGSEMAVGVNAGVIAVLHQRTQVGFMVTNINNPHMGEGVGHSLPQQFAIGISYIPYQGVITAVDLKKNFEGSTELRGGVEVELHPMLCLRMGIRNNPASYSFGAGFNVAGITVDYGANTHAVLDITHHFSIGYKF